VLRNFVIGPAVDEAAEWADEADGALVWLRPEANALLEIVDPDGDGLRRHLVRNYDVPIKSQESIPTGVINPRGDEVRETSERDLDAVLGFFDRDKPGVDSKYKHTKAFFDAVLRER
jgi:hypothetical protein